jgi:hypothetical protein
VAQSGDYQDPDGSVRHDNGPGIGQIPPDLVVKHQAVDIVEIISSLIWRRNIV